MGSCPHTTGMTPDDDGGGPAASLTVRGTSTAVSLLVVLAARSSDGAVRTGETNSVEVAAGAEGLQMLSVIGAGRASQAASATGASTVAVSPDGRYAVVEGWERTEVWSVDATPTLVVAFDTPRTLEHAEGSVDSVDFFPDGSNIVSL